MSTLLWFLICVLWLSIGFRWGMMWEKRKTHIQHERYLAGLAVVAKQIRENERAT